MVVVMVEHADLYPVVIGGNLISPSLIAITGLIDLRIEQVTEAKRLKVSKNTSRKSIEYKSLGLKNSGPARKYTWEEGYDNQ